jgi:hypothetical protein
MVKKKKETAAQVRAAQIQGALLQMKKGVPMRKAARNFGLKHNSLIYHAKKSEFDHQNFTGGRKPLLSRDLEKRLADWADEMSERGFLVDQKLLSEKARLLNKDLKCSQRWFFNVTILPSITIWKKKKKKKKKKKLKNKK